MNEGLPTLPRVGMGCTVCHISDRYPATVRAINKNGTIIVVQHDQATVTSGSMQDGSARYDITEDPTNRQFDFVKQNRAGEWRTEGGQFVHFGNRERYYDPHF